MYCNNRILCFFARCRPDPELKKARCRPDGTTSRFLQRAKRGAAKRALQEILNGAPTGFMAGAEIRCFRDDIAHTRQCFRLRPCRFFSALGRRAAKDRDESAFYGGIFHEKVKKSLVAWIDTQYGDNVDDSLCDCECDSFGRNGCGRGAKVLGRERRPAEDSVFGTANLTRKGDADAVGTFPVKGNTLWEMSEARGTCTQRKWTHVLRRGS